MNIARPNQVYVNKLCKELQVHIVQHTAPLKPGLRGQDTHGRLSAVSPREDTLQVPVCSPAQQISSEKGSIYKERIISQGEFFFSF